MGAQSYLKSDRRITQLYGWLVAESLRIDAAASAAAMLRGDRLICVQKSPVTPTTLPGCLLCTGPPQAQRRPDRPNA